MRNQVLIYLNGEKHLIDNNKVSMMLADYLRYELCLTGTKVVCAEGDCGACSVLSYNPNDPNSKNFEAFNSCITPLACLDGQSIITVEALAQEKELYQSQKSIKNFHGSQCGFCTPGFVIALAALNEKKISQNETKLTETEAKNALTGNLCRCTGYGPIIDAALSMELSSKQSLMNRFFNQEQSDELRKSFSQELLIRTDQYQFFAPKTIKQACSYLSKEADCKIIGSGTDLGVIHNKRKIKLSNLMSLHLIPELYDLKKDSDKVHIGARISLTQVRSFLKKSFSEFSDYLDIFASPQIKNIATLVGNIANASPIGDTPSALLALEAKLDIVGPLGQREIPLSDFFLDYRRTDLAHDEIIRSISFNLPSNDSSVKFYKNSNRKDLDISAVNLSIKVDWANKEKTIIKKSIIAAGGIAAIPLRLKKTENLLKDKKIDNHLLEKAALDLHTEFKPLSDIRASSAYRHVLIENYFKKFFRDHQTESRP